MHKQQQQVSEFMELGQQTTNDKFTEMSVKDIELSHKLVKEEVVNELLPELEKLIYASEEFEEHKDRPLVTDEGVKETYIKLMDAVADSLYVILGIPVRLGIDVVPYFEEAHRSNMTKFVEATDGNFYPIKRDDGKTMKPASYSEADFRTLIENDIDFAARESRENTPISG